MKKRKKKKEKQVEIRKKIEYSMQLNASRIKDLQAQDDLVNSMKKMLSLLQLKEPSVLMCCRKDDYYFVESVLHSAEHEYAEKATVHPLEIIVDHLVYLPPAPSHHNAHGPYCSGVVLASRDGKIVCENTLDARFDVVFSKKLPKISGVWTVVALL